MLSIAHIHPMIVHFPIVFFLTLAALDTVLMIGGREIVGRGCTGSVSASLAVLAGLAAIVAFVFGDLAFDAAVSAGFPEADLETHEGLGTSTAIAFVVWALVRGYLWWRGSTVGGGLKVAAVVIELAGAALVIVTGYFGGQLVYELGVNVSRAAGG
jgi:uncharacterized membrane protein